MLRKVPNKGGMSTLQNIQADAQKSIRRQTDTIGINDLISKDNSDSLLVHPQQFKKQYPLFANHLIRLNKSLIQ